jgi:hypothetical protein
MHRFDGLVWVSAERWRRTVLSHSGGGLAAARPPPDRLDALSRIVSFDDVPIARRRMMCGQPEQGFERNVPVEAAIVAKDEFIRGIAFGIRRRHWLGFAFRVRWILPGRG